MLTRTLSSESPELSALSAECRRTGKAVCVAEGAEQFVMMDMAAYKAMEAQAARAASEASAKSAEAKPATLLAMGVVAAG